MSNSQKYTAWGGITAVGASAAITTRYLFTNRAAVAQALSPRTTGGLLRLLLFLFSLLNIKNLPFVWHFRFLIRGLLYHFRLDPKTVPPDSLFEPIVTSTRAPLLECDSNLHKSNSTYFTDLDQSRAHLYACLLRKGFMYRGKDNAEEFRRVMGVSSLPSTSLQNDSAAENSSSTSTVPIAPSISAVPTVLSVPSVPTLPEPKGSYNMLLGSVSCHYHREIPPYARYELWSRILAWDGKWFYSVTHIVKPGTAVPARWTMQPWRKTTRRASKNNKSEIENKHRNKENDAINDAAEQERRKDEMRKNVYATSMAKVVVKKGRLTIPPEVFLRRAGVLPPKTEQTCQKDNADPATDGHVPTGRAGGNVIAKPLDASDATEDNNSKNTNNNNKSGNDSNNTDRSHDKTWTWTDVEARRRAGLVLAEKFAALDAAQALFDSGAAGALGRYADLFWA